MKHYKTKRELEAVIRAVIKSLNGKWSVKNKGLGEKVLHLRCPLCQLICGNCPLLTTSDGSCGRVYTQFLRHPTPANFMAMRRKLQAVKRQLIKQLEAR